MKRTPTTRLAITRLEDRSLPATFFLSGTSLGVFDSLGADAENLQAEIDARNTTDVNKAFLINSGDKLIFDANEDRKFNPGERVLLDVAAGKAMVFLRDTLGPTANAFDENEIGGLAVSNGFRATINTDVQGSIVTALDATGNFTGVALQNNSIAGLTIAGRVGGSIYAGKDIANVSIGSGLFTLSAERSVAHVATGNATGVLGANYGNSSVSFLMTFTQTAGTSAGSISNLKLKNGALEIKAGDGGNVTVGSGNGGAGGNISGVSVVDSPN